MPTAVETMLYKKSGLLGISGISNDMRDLIAQRRSGRASRRRLLRLSRGEGDRRPGRRARRRRRHRLHRRHRRAVGGDPPAHLRRVGVARARDRSRRQRAPRAANFDTRQRDRSVGRADQRGARDRPPHRTVAWLDRSPRLAREKDRHIMTATAAPTKKTGPAKRLEGISIRPLAGRHRRPRFHPAELHAVRRRRIVPRAARPQRTLDIWARLTALFPEERKKGVLDISPIPSTITAHAPGYIDKDNEIIVGLQTEAPLRRAIMPNGGFRMVLGALKTYGYTRRPERRRNLHQVPQDAQRRGVRRLHRRHAPLPELAHPHRTAGRVRARPHHRRLSSCRALRRRSPDRAEEAGEGGARLGAVQRRNHSRSRRVVRADARARRAQENGRELRLRHLEACEHREGSRAVVVFRVPRRRERAERRSHVAWPHLDVPRHLLRARSRRAPASPRSRRRR